MCMAVCVVGVRHGASPHKYQFLSIKRTKNAIKKLDAERDETLQRWVEIKCDIDYILNVIKSVATCQFIASEIASRREKYAVATPNAR